MPAKSENTSENNLESTPKTIYLKDYQAPVYELIDVYLTFHLVNDATIVNSVINFQKSSLCSASDTAIPLKLDGEELELLCIKYNNKELSSGDYTLTKESLILTDVTDDIFKLEIETRINPAGNTSLSGLYLSSGNFCTQCEAEGFRKITYFPDRPDVMTRYTTKLIADKSKYPVLLSNGDCIAKGDLDNNQHWAEFSDPFPKPSYLFALVAGDLSCIEDEYKTMSGTLVKLFIYVEHHNIDKCEHAMNSLKNSMRWDEEVYGREYDLNTYVIVAVDDFNMGAMENKALNVFNSKYVLAKPETATDRDYQDIEGVIGHEYFHNWSGNRVTCRDWFQLSLKEGFTVFRDQQFSADMTSSSVKRIEDVNVLRSYQFREDAGPMSHPIRPESYVEINNFYTATVYNKGAEVVRMLYNLLGKVGFRKGTDLYFDRHDGQAVTTDDFVKALEDANKIDLTQFRLWYSQSGTPELIIHGDYNEKDKTYIVNIKQSCPDTPGQTEKKPYHIPVAIGLVDSHGNDLPIKLADSSDEASKTKVLNVKKSEETFCLIDIPEKPVPSILRGFSAPVKLTLDLDDSELCFLMSADSDGFNRWESAQQLYIKTILQLIKDHQSGNTMQVGDHILTAVKKSLIDPDQDKALIASSITLPSEAYISEFMTIIDPEAIHLARQFLKRTLASFMSKELLNIYEQNKSDEIYSIDQVSMAKRCLKNTCLDYLMELADPSSVILCVEQFKNSNNMTDTICAFSALVNSECKERDTSIEEFYGKWQSDSLVTDKWFALQATSRHPGTISRVIELINHEGFSIKNPNKIRSLIGAFSAGNQFHFHSADGRGYNFLGEYVIKIDSLNPQIASRLVSNFSFWKRFDEKRQGQMKAQLLKIKATPGLSKDVFEIVSKSLD